MRGGGVAARAAVCRPEAERNGLSNPGHPEAGADAGDGVGRPPLAGRVYFRQFVVTTPGIGLVSVLLSQNDTMVPLFEKFVPF